MGGGGGEVNICSWQLYGMIKKILFGQTNILYVFWRNKLILYNRIFFFKYTLIFLFGV